MRAVWSFWTRPYLARTGHNWATPLHHMLAWGLSVSTARQHYPDTALITDSPGKKLLVDTLGIQFSSVSTELDRLSGADPGWWVLGKLIAYGLQDVPFLHIDTDVFLWRPLPLDLEEAPVVAQCPEFFQRGSDRSSRRIEEAFVAVGAQLPIEWEWAASRNDLFFREENCGIVGGTNVVFLRHFATTASDLVLNPDNASACARLAYKDNFALEQFLLSACVDFHRHRPDSPFRGVRVRYLFPTWDDAMNPTCAERVGFTHLLGGSKAMPAVGLRLEERMKRDDPAYYRHCERIAGRMA